MSPIRVGHDVSVTDLEPSFSSGLFAFMRDLAANNDREWFAEHKERYVAEVQEPALAFIEDVGMRLPEEISPHFVADPRTTGGSLFRIYRDTRFSKDKTPYKTHCGVQFRHARTRDVHAPGFYLHLEPGNVFMACGTWRPEREVLHLIRTGIAGKPARWTALVEGLSPLYALGGDSLKRPPAGFDKEHPLIEELKRKDFIAHSLLTEKDVTSGGFLDLYLERCAAAGEFMRFLCESSRVAY